jgi:hypothetical protein
MVRHVAKLKSGVLPKPRDILPRIKTFWEIEEESKAPSGFADPDMVPKGVDPNPKPKHELSMAERIRYSAKQPKAQDTMTKEVGEVTKWKLMASEMRRRYYIDSLQAEDQMNKKKLATREQKFREAREARLKVDNSEESQSTKFTLPTIESFFDGPFVRHRTKEEKAELFMKRAANRKYHEIKHKEKHAEKLLELYQNAENYIITEQALDQEIDKVFTAPESTGSNFDLIVKGSSKSVESLFLNNRAQHALRAELTMRLMGTTSNGLPGLPEVEDALNDTRIIDENQKDSNS